jgi:hypothetical protein
MTVMARVAILGLVCLSAGLQAQDDFYLYTNLIKNGKGAYEDYVLAGERMRDSVARTLVDCDTVERFQQELRLAEAKVGEDEEPSSSSLAQLAKLRAAMKALPNEPGRPTQLDLDRAIAKDFGPAWVLILRGNQKPRISPRTHVDAQTSFPELAFLRMLPRFAMSKARVEFAKGNASGALSTYRETYKFIQRIGSEYVVSRLVTTRSEAILFAEIERYMTLIPSVGLADFIEDLRTSIGSSPRITDCIAVEQDFFRRTVAEMAKQFESSDASTALPEFDDKVPPEEWEEFRAAIVGMTLQERRDLFNSVVLRHDAELQAFLVKLGQPENRWPFSAPASRPRSNASTILKLHALNIEGLAQNEAAARTRTRIAIITLLAREHAWQHGAYPASLKDFLPESSTVDPLTNQPYKYSILNGAVVVKTATHPVLGEISLRRPPRSDANSANGGRVILP